MHFSRGAQWMPADAARRDPALRSFLRKKEKVFQNSINLSGKEGCVQDGAHRDSSAPRACCHQVHRGGDHARSKCTQPNGIDLSIRKMSTDQGNLCPMLKQTTAMPIVSQGYNITSSYLHLESTACSRRLFQNCLKE